MKRPLLLRCLPYRLRESLYYRHYHTRCAAFTGLFDRAPLAFAGGGGIVMHGLIPGDVISNNIAFNGFYELGLTRQMKQLAKKGTAVLVDVGANMGYFSLLWASMNKANRVIAFEAAPRNLEILKTNIALNNLSDRVALVPKAAGRYTGTMAFDVGPAEQTGWGGAATVASATTVEVPVVRLDHELPANTIDVLKIDVEGADTWVLFGCEGLIRKGLIGRIFFEQNKGRMEQLGIAIGEAQTFLRDFNYTCVPFGGSDNQWLAYPNGK